MISFEEFKKLDLRMGRITAAERVPDSEKLIRLEVDCGSEKRQLVAGIGRVYEPAALLGKEIPLVANLEPRTLRGFESQGMILAADDRGEPVLLFPDREVPPGSTIR